ncbi:MAG TPA: hypothetical protein PLF71_03180 [bacterium]|nr:MAG: hypothetical protein BWY14_01046 [Parcubacteria group bacterium ADurb.Bin192]HPN15089.1 hypothetical protein [bacterium]
MPKQKAYTTAKPNKNGLILTLNKQQLDKKIRKTSAPASQLHLNKKAYNRKEKHPKKTFTE